MALPTPEKALEQARDWLGEEPGVTVGDDESISVDGDPPISIELAVEDERLLIRHVAKEDGAGATRADAVVSAVPDRGTQLDVAAAVSKSGVTFTYTNPVYLDGLSRQAVVTALNELVTTVDRMAAVDPNPATSNAAVEEPEAESGAEPEPATLDPEPRLDEVPQEESDEAQTLVVGDIFAADTTETTQVPVEPTGWGATHRVPVGGMRAWDEPDPSLQPSSRLEARVELQVAERRGDWARVVGSNGWTGWVDARKLEAMATRGERSSKKVAVGGLELSPLPLVGAAGLILAAFMPWVSAFGSSSNSFEVALSFLWDFNAAGNPYLGWALVAVAVLIGVLAAVKKPNAGLMVLLGVIAIAIAAVFVVQMYRGVSDSGGTFGDVFDFLGIAPWIAVGSGVVVLVGSRR